jgi:hypothetical protein
MTSAAAVAAAYTALARPSVRNPSIRPVASHAGGKIKKS